MFSASQWLTVLVQGIRYQSVHTAYIWENQVLGFDKVSVVVNARSMLLLMLGWIKRTLLIQQIALLISGVLVLLVQRLAFHEFYINTSQIYIYNYRNNQTN